MYPLNKVPPSSHQLPKKKLYKKSDFFRHSFLSVDGRYDRLIIPSVFGTSVVSAYV